MLQRTNISNYGCTGSSPFRRSGDEVVAYILSTTDYDPFGMIMNGRDWNPGEYRFGFNGKESDKEVYGEKNSYDFGARIYDSRAGRWLSLDPLQAKYPSLSAYNFCANNPIFFVDPDGRKIDPSNAYKSQYGTVYDDLKNNNSIYRLITANYINSSINNIFMLLDEGEGIISKNAFATTKSNRTIEKKYTIDKNGVKTNISTTIFVKSVQWYDGIGDLNRKKIIYEDDHKYIIKQTRTDIAKAKTIIHESIHSMMFEKQESDENHNGFSKYQPLILSALQEYNTDNRLGYSDEELTTLSWSGMQMSDAFKSYINERASKNSNTYENEFNNWLRELENLSYKDSSKEVVMKRMEPKKSNILKQ